MKTCKICDKYLLDEKFRLYRKTCLKCESEISARWAKNNPQRKHELNKRYLKSFLGKEALKSKTKRFRAKYPDKYKAYTLVQTAKRNGSLVREQCINCGADNADAHHSDYKKPLEVKWLCQLCHAETHKAMIAEGNKSEG